jgi:TRAP-type C4-dicarboxylate transport system substrate-binding protein
MRTSLPIDPPVHWKERHMKARPLLIAFAAALALGAAQAQVAKFGYGASEDNSQGQGARRMADIVKTATAGRVTITTYASGTLGSDPKMQSALQGGVQELMVGPTSNLVGDHQGIRATRPAFPGIELQGSRWGCSMVPWVPRSAET